MRFSSRAAPLGHKRSSPSAASHRAASCQPSCSSCQPNRYCVAWNRPTLELALSYAGDLAVLLTQLEGLRSLCGPIKAWARATLLQLSHSRTMVIPLFPDVPLEPRLEATQAFTSAVDDGPAAGRFLQQLGFGGSRQFWPGGLGVSLYVVAVATHACHKSGRITARSRAEGSRNTQQAVRQAHRQLGALR